MRFATCIAGIALLAAACGNKTNTEPGNTAEVKSAGGSASRGAKGSAAAGSGEAPKRTAVTAKSLSPVLIHDHGPDNVVPSAVVIEFALPIVGQEAIGTQSPASNLKITPSLAGRLVHTGVSELTFTPNRSFEFDTGYQVELVGIDTADGTIAPGTGDKWSYSFKTPPFRLNGWSPTDIDVDHHKITMDMAFSGAVLPNAVKAAATFGVDGKPPAGVGMLPSP